MVTPDVETNSQPSANIVFTKQIALVLNQPRIVLKLGGFFKKMTSFFFKVRDGCRSLINNVSEVS